MNIFADDIVRHAVRARDPALYLRIIDLCREKRKRFGRIIAWLHFKRGPIDCPAVEPRRRSGFQPAKRKV